jgi:hypothetical protein
MRRSVDATAGVSHTSGASNGGTEAINLIIEKIRRLAYDLRDFDHYRLRILLASDGRRRTQTDQPMLKPEEIP